MLAQSIGEITTKVESLKPYVMIDSGSGSVKNDHKTNKHFYLFKYIIAV